jgi:hypothetical protein
LWIPHCLDNQLIDGGNVVSLTHQPRSTPQNIILLLLVLISVTGLVQLEGLGKMKKLTSSGLEPVTFLLMVHLAVLLTGEL